MPNPISNRLHILCLLALASPGSISTLRAANLTWDPGNTVNGGIIDPGNGTWNTSLTYWNDGAGNLAWTAANVAVFGGADGTYSVSVSSLSAQKIRFDKDGYTLAGASPGQVLTLTDSSAGNPGIIIAAGKTATIAAGFTVERAASNVLAIGGGGTLNISGTVNPNSSSNSVSLEGDDTVVKVSSGGILQTKSGNTHAGFTVGGAATSVGKVTTLHVDGGTVKQQAYNTDAHFSVGGAGSGVVILTSGSITIDAPVNGLVFGNGGISGNTNTFNLDGGTLTTYKVKEGSTAPTSIFNFNGGTLKATTDNTAFMTGLDQANVKAGGARINTNGQDITIAQALLNGGGGGGLTKIGSGTLTLSAPAGNSYTGGTTIQAGSINWNHSSALGTGTVTLNNASTGGSSTGLNRGSGGALGNDIVVTNQGTGTVTIGGATGPTDVTYNGTVALGRTTRLEAGNASRKATFNGAISGAGGIDKTGSGTVVLANASNSYTGSVNLLGGTLSVDRVDDIDEAQPLGKGATPITFAAAATLAITGNGSTSRGLKLGNHANTLSVGTSATVDMSGNITDGGTSAYFYKTGEGTFNYSGAGAWNGNLHIQQGAFEVSGSGATPGPGGDGIGETVLSNTGSTLRITSSTASLSTSKVIIGSGTTVDLEAGTLRTNAITRTGTFTWGGGTLATVGNNATGLVDRTDNSLPDAGALSGPVVREGNILKFAGNLATTTDPGKVSILDLGPLRFNGGVRYNQLQVTGDLNLSNNDRLNFEINPGFLRPTSPNALTTGDWGTLILAWTSGTITGEFDSITGIQNDAIGWRKLGSKPGDPSFLSAAALPIDTYFIEYRAGGVITGQPGVQAGAAILFHYKVSGSIPEPASAGLMIAGALLLRALRRNRGKA